MHVAPIALHNKYAWDVDAMPLLLGQNKNHIHAYGLDYFALKIFVGHKILEHKHTVEY